MNQDRKKGKSLDRKSKTHQTLESCRGGFGGVNCPGGYWVGCSEKAPRALPPASYWLAAAEPTGAAKQHALLWQDGAGFIGSCALASMTSGVGQFCQQVYALWD